MSLRLNRASLLLGLFLAGDALALGLGEIRLSSALNEPLRAEIQLLSTTPEELAGLRVELAPAATFDRYGIDRPHFLTRFDFDVVDSNQPGGDIVRITSDQPVTEPFVTFLVEASWPGGRLLREYTVLLDPPTFAPPPTAESPQAVTAPQRQQQADSGRIERPAAPAPRQPAADPAPFDATSGGDVQVQRGDTLWQIAERVRPDNRLSMNQVMLAIYEANPQAFAGNINRLNAGATLRVPSADDIFRINRAGAVSEVQRHNADFGIADSGRAQPSLTLVPPDGDQPQYDDVGSSPAAGAPDSDAESRIRELERMVEDQQSLIEIRDSELASLREELARLRAESAEAAAAAGEEAGPPADEPVAAEEADQVFADDEPPAEPVDGAADEPADEPAEAAPAEDRPAPTVAATPPAEPGLVERITGILTGFWGILGIVLLLVIAILLWLAKRAAGTGEEDSTGVWETLDEGDIDSESRASTERLRALARDDDSAIVVVEQESSPDRRRAADTQEVPAAQADPADTGVQPTLEDTFSSETAINLDQSDPIAEADFHMAYGLYDQAADLVNGALAAEPERQDLMAKLCEIYFVWGNKDAFVEAAGRLDDQLGGESTPDWDKIVIMGQQIAPDHRLFSGASAGGATKAVDLSFDEDGGDAALDMDFGSGPDGEVSDVIDLGGEEGGEESSADYSGLDFTFDEEEADTGASTTREMTGRDTSDEETVESPTIESEVSDHTVESPTVERPLDSLESTSEMPSLSDAGDDAQRSSGDATAEIDLDDLGLDLEALAESGLADTDEESSSRDWDTDATSEQRALGSDLDETGRNFLDDGPADETAETGIMEGPDAGELDATGEMPSMEEATGKNPALEDQEEHGQTDVDFDSGLLDATGQTQILTDDQDDVANDDNAETLLAPMDADNDSDDEETHEATAALNPKDIDLDFARTEALPEGSFSGGDGDETAEVPAAAGTDVDLDFDDLASALQHTEGDTVDQPRDEETVEQPKATSSDAPLDLDFGDLDGDDDSETQALSPDDMSDDLHNARTMTEVGTKLDLARAYVDMGDPDGARSILEEVIDEGDEGQRQQAQKLLDTLPV